MKQEQVIKAVKTINKDTFYIHDLCDKLDIKGDNKKAIKNLEGHLYNLRRDGISIRGVIIDGRSCYKKLLIHKIGDKRIGICKHTKKEVEQVFDGVSNDSEDENGWLCLH